METKYRTFWRRYWAAVIDSCLLAPFAVVLIAIGSQETSQTVQIILHLIGSFFGVAYSVFLHGRFGQTLGKMVTRIKVVDLAEQPIGLRPALWRDGPTIFFSMSTAFLGTVAAIDGVNPMSFDGIAATPPILVFANLFWILAEFVTMLTNKRRRAIHDWIAGTLVVRTKPSTNPAAGIIAVAGNPAG